MRHNLSYYCLLARATHIIFVLHAHPVRGELHNQRNTTGEVATIPGQITFFFLKHDMQNCCLVTLTCWTEFLVSHFNLNDIF